MKAINDTMLVKNKGGLSTKQITDLCAFLEKNQKDEYNYEHLLVTMFGEQETMKMIA
jgi:hypothetical protein